MPTRPSIPADVKLRVRTESGDRCAVCGSLANLEFVHIRPWSKSRDNSADNLIYLCANCCDRKDREMWNEKQLYQYKDKPWVARSEWTGPPGTIDPLISTLTEIDSSATNSCESGEPVMDDPIDQQHRRNVRFLARAKFAYEELSRAEQSQVRDALNRIRGEEEDIAEMYHIHKLPTDEPLYLIRVNADLRLIVRTANLGGVEVLDLVRHETLKTFGALQDAQQ